MGFSSLTRRADAAGDHRVGHVSTADFDPFRVFPETLDRATEFVAHHEGRLSPFATIFESFEFASTNPAGGDMQEDFAGGRGGNGKVADFEVVVFRIKERLHGMGIEFGIEAVAVSIINKRPHAP